MREPRALRKAARRAGGFPEWAPPSLVRGYQRLDEELSNTTLGDHSEQDWMFTRLDVTHLFITAPRMESVWAALRGRHRLSDDQVDQLADETTRSLLAFDAVPRRTRSAHKTNFTKVAELSNQLRECISGDLGSWSARASEYFDTNHLGRTLQQAKLPEESRALVNLTVRQWLSAQDGPTFSHLLADLALQAEHVAKITPILRKPQGRVAKGHFVALRLCAYFRRQLRSPLYGHVATMAYVTTGVDLDLEAVRKICSRRGI